MSKKYQLVFQKAPNKIFIVKLKRFTPAIRIRSSNLIENIKIFQKVKTHTKHSDQDTFGEGNFWRVQIQMVNFFDLSKF